MVATKCGNSDSRGRMSAGQTGHMTGQMGHVHGIDGTHTHTHQAVFLQNSFQSKHKSERAKGAEKVLCGETVVQKGVLESPFLLCPLKVFRRFQCRA